jgi:SAM-dependent methyltransferase
VTALDASAAMVVETRRKGDAADVGEGLKVRLRTIEEWTAEERTPLIDGVLSNFGALNCVADLDAVAAALASALRPGGRAVLVVMGPWVPWEWFWYLVHGAPTKAFRRLQRGGVRWRGLVVRYPSPGTLKKHFEPAFRVRRLTALGLLVPPSYAEGWAGRHPRLVEALARLERRLAGWPPAAWLADHYILELERSQESTG